jgi:predicted nucleotidyltransferase
MHHETEGYKMIPAVAERSDELRRLCLRYGVQRLGLFGSAASGAYHQEKSDLDFVVEFNPTALAAYTEAYFGLLEGLEQLFGASVDLVVESAIRNPYFLQSVEQTRTPIYEA